MKRAFVGLLVALCLMLTCSAARAATYFTFNPGFGNSGGSGGMYELGSEFTVGVDAIRVTDVGQWAGVGTQFANLGTTTTVSFWKPLVPNGPTGSLITSGSVPSGTPSDAGGFSFAPITPFQLEANTTYIVSSFNPGFFKADNTGGIFGPGITYLHARVHVPAGSPGFPELSNSATGYWGGTFKYTVLPEPASLSLVALSGLLLIRRRRGDA